MSLFKKAAPEIYEAMSEAETQVKAFDIEPKLKELIKIRASQINGCGYCIDLHTRDARAIGESEQRIYALSAWWETPFFTEKEQLVLRLTEAVTQISEEGVPEELREEAIKMLGEQGFAHVVFTIITINSWNRLAIPSHLMPEPETL
ncbi:carboxymuconolactone decarboxylase family protein [Aliifodinibius sp. S!AR15-10]|uniref:carboxymuconolactone decarboxylase family protein n=1 Tax=Aliifodinibius sp. S!AR15-10 TaxID=2950437 RepID=UPI00285CEC65|nr:carboxymuconolactone decarboxylase family protein [Aliifodinibius sp. S!AR15-10]MDR8391366.1 carboxymuconolactone decarboxylase family protein [Aliifodinibius sp. S!AR15-10]